MIDASHIDWEIPWHPISPDQGQKMEAELRSEVCRGHVLYGRKCTAIGHRQDCDDVLFWLNETETQLAVVHLSFSKESDPMWPTTALYESLGCWVAECMKPDAEEFNS